MEFGRICGPGEGASRCLGHRPLLRLYSTPPLSLWVKGLCPGFWVGHTRTSLFYFSLQRREFLSLVSGGDSEAPEVKISLVFYLRGMDRGTWRVRAALE